MTKERERVGLLENIISMVSIAVSSFFFMMMDKTLGGDTLSLFNFITIAVFIIAMGVGMFLSWDDDHVFERDNYLFRYIGSSALSAVISGLIVVSYWAFTDKTPILVESSILFVVMGVHLCYPKLDRKMKMKKAKKKEKRRNKIVSVGKDYEEDFEIVVGGLIDDYKLIENREGLSDYSFSIKQLINQCKSLSVIVDEDLRSELTKCALAIILVYHASYLHLSELYKISYREETVNRELKEAKVYERYIVAANDIEDIVNKARDNENSKLVAIDNEKKEYADLMIKNLVDKL